MPFQPCDPVEIDRIAKLISEGKYGEMSITPISVESEIEAKSVSETLRNTQLGGFAPWRTVRAAMGDYFAAAAHNDITIAQTRALNHTAKAVEGINNATKGLQRPDTFVGRTMDRFFGISTETDKELGAALENIGSKGEFLTKDVEKRFAPETIKAARELRQVTNKFYDDYIAKDPLLAKVIPDPATFIQGYLPRIKQLQNQGLFWARTNVDAESQSFISRLSPEHIKFFHEMERTGLLLNYEKRATVALNSYIHSMMRAKFLKPELQRIEKEVVNPMFNLRFVRKADDNSLRVLVNDPVGYMYWQEYKHNLLGGPTAGDLRQAARLRRFAKYFGYDTDIRSVYYASNMISHLFYSGVMGAPVIGGRPSSVIRQLGQMVPTYAELGTRHTLVGLKKALDDMAESVGTGAFGVGPEGKRLMEQGLITSHLDNMVSSLETSQTVSRLAGTIAHDSLKLFSAMDRFTRFATAFGAENKFDEALSAGIETLKAGRELKTEIIRRVKLGRVEDAKQLYVKDTLSALQYEYGKANRPEMFRGAFGNVMGMMMSYPLNTVEMVRVFAKRGLQDNDWMPMIRLLAASSALTYGGSELLNADLRSMFFFSALPHSVSGLKIPLDFYQAGMSFLEWMTGNLYNVGETQFATKKRNEHYNEALRDLGTLLPGFGTYQDITKIIAEGSLARALALTPKAERLDELAKERRQEAARVRARENTGGMGLTGLSGF